MACGLQSWSPEPDDKPHLTEGGATKQLPLKDKKNKNKKQKPAETPQSPGETKTELLLKYQHQDWKLKE
jgi:hypothetical protein